MTARQRAHDAELISAVRADDLAAWDELCRRHLEAARRLARTLVPAKAADELVTRAAERVLTDLRRGEGPDVAFRTYLLEGVRREQRPPVGPPQAAPPDGAEAGGTRPVVRAFRSLPERWQLVLWHVDVEREQPAEVAPLVGVAARSMPAVVRRARAGLRTTTLDVCLWEADEPHPDCEWTRDHLLAYVRDAATRRESGRVGAHLQGCAPCRSVHAELAAVDDLAGVLGPPVLGTAATEYLAPRRVGLVARHPGGAALAGVAAALVLITGFALGLGGRAEDPPVAEAPPAGLQSGQQTADGVVLERSPSEEPDDEASPTEPGSAQTTPTPSSPPPTSDSPSDDPTTGSPEADLTNPPTSAPPPTPPPTSPPPTTPPPPPGAVDPAVAAVRLPKTTGPDTKMLVEIDDVAETDGILTVTSNDPAVEFRVDRRCTPVAGTSSLVCDLADDPRPVELIADLSAVTGTIEVDFAIKPKHGVVETPAQRENNQKSVPLEAPTNGG